MIKSFFLFAFVTTMTPTWAAEDEDIKPREILASPKVLVEESYLRDVLPSSALAYARIPNSWSLTGIPVGNVFDKALGSKSYVDAVNSIRDGLSNTVIPELPEEARILSQFFLQNSRSPIEAILIPSLEQNKLIPNILITTKVNFSQVEPINYIIDDLEKKDPKIIVKKLLNENDVAELISKELKVQIKLDSASSRLYVLGGIELLPDSMTKTLEQLQPNNTHQMRQLESDIDASGQGSFVWFDPRKLLVLAKMMEPKRRLSKQQRQLEQMAMWEINRIKNIAVGLGSSKGINKLKLILDMPRTGVRAFLPSINTAPDFKLSGKTGLVAVLGLPTKQDYISIESTIATFSPSDEMADYFRVKKEFSNKTGFEIEDVFDVLGQDISLVSDEAGHYLAVRLKDSEKFESMLSELVEKYNLKYEVRTVSTQKYHHLSVPAVDTGLIQELENQGRNQEFLKLFKRITSIPSHYYWQQKGEYLLVANVPQILMDRHYLKSHIAVNDWFKKEQRMDPNGALLMASIRTKGVPASMYRARLEVIKFLGDLVDRPVDMFTLPSAREVQLPNEGAYGIKLSSNEKQLALEVSFESNPLEIILAGKPYAVFALAGIVAQYFHAPAYYDLSKKPKSRSDAIDRILIEEAMEAAKTSPVLEAKEAAESAAAVDTVESTLSAFIKTTHTDIEATWLKIFERTGKRYPVTELVLYRGSKHRACGLVGPTNGAFYCPGDQKIHIDLDFFKDLHRKQGTTGDLAQAYVIAHLIGHHVQNLEGTFETVQRAKQRIPGAKGNELQVMLELQADCYAGVWAAHQQKQFKSVEKSDLEEALSVVASIGDDRLQKKKRDFVIPDTFTHGSLKQRLKWFSNGAKKGRFQDCQTFVKNELEQAMEQK